MKDTYEHAPVTTGFDRSLSDALAAKHGIELERQMQTRMGEGFGLLVDDQAASMMLKFGRYAQFACFAFACVVPNLLFMKFALGWF